MVDAITLNVRQCGFYAFTVDRRMCLLTATHQNQGRMQKSDEVMRPVDGEEDSFVTMIEGMKGWRIGLRPIRDSPERIQRISAE